MTRDHYSHQDSYNTNINDVTGGSLRTKPPSDLFRETFERIFGVAKPKPTSTIKETLRETTHYL